MKISSFGERINTTLDMVGQNFFQLFFPIILWYAGVGFFNHTFFIYLLSYSELGWNAFIENILFIVGIGVPLLFYNLISVVGIYFIVEAVNKIQNNEKISWKYLIINGYKNLNNIYTMYFFIFLVFLIPIILFLLAGGMILFFIIQEGFQYNFQFILSIITCIGVLGMLTWYFSILVTFSVFHGISVKKTCWKEFIISLKLAHKYWGYILVQTLLISILSGVVLGMITMPFQQLNIFLNFDMTNLWSLLPKNDFKYMILTAIKALLNSGTFILLTLYMYLFYKYAYMEYKSSFIEKNKNS